MTTVVTAAYQSAVVYPLNHARICYSSHVAELAAAAITVSSAQTGFPKDAPTRPDTYEGWRPSGGGTWTADLGSAKAVNYVGIVGDLSGVLVTVAYASSAGGPWTTFATAVTPTDNSPILLFGAQVTARYWRVTLGAEATMYVVYLGQEMVMPRPYFDGSTPPNLDRQTEVRSAQTRGGNFIGQDIMRFGVKTKMAWSNLDPTWYRNTFDLFVKHARSKPFFYAWNLNFPNETAYLWTSENITPALSSQTAGGLVSVGFSSMGISSRE